MVNMPMVNMPMVNMLVVNIQANPAEFRNRFSELQDLGYLRWQHPRLLAWGSARPGGCGSACDSQVLATGPREVLSRENIIPEDR
jgi:hypothetical protein